MATTFIDYTGDGNATKSFSFPSIQESDVKVEVDTVLKSSGTHYNITNYTTTGGGNVVFTSGNIPSSPAAIRIFRDTNVDSAKATYTAGSSVKAADLNNNHEQLLFAAQEEQNQTVITSDIKDAAVTTAKIAADAITGAKIADNAIGTEHLQNDSVRTSDIKDVNVTTAKIADSNVTTAKIADANVTTAKIADSNVTTAKIADSNVTTAKLQNGAVAHTKIADANVIESKIAANAVTTSKIADANVTTAKIADLAVTTAKIAADAIRGAKIADDQINSEHLVDGCVNTVHITDSHITTAKISDGAVTTAKLANGNVTTPKMADSSITTSKIATNAVTTDKIADSELSTLAGMQSATASKLADSTALTADIADLNQIDGMAKQTTITDDDTKFPTSGAVVDYVAAQLEPFGGFEAIANEVSFPNTQPPSGVAISIADAAGIVVNSSGTSTTGRTLNGTTVTINNINSQYNSSTVASGIRFIVTSTGSGQVYNYHKSTLPESDLVNLSGDINDFNERYRVGGSNPTTSLDAGDLFYNTGTNKLLVYNATNSAWEETQSIGNFFINTISSSSATGGGSATPNGTAYRFTLSNAGTTAEQHIVSVDGVIQKPNSGTSQPSEGFAVDGADIIFGAAPVSGASVFVITIGAAVGIGTPSNNTVTTAILQNGSVTTAKIVDANVTTAKIANSAITSNKIAANAVGTARIQDSAITSDKIASNAVGAARIADGAVTSAKIADGTIVNADINASAAIAGSKISPDFGSQNVQTTGTVIGGGMTISNAQPKLTFTDTNHNSDFRLFVEGGVFQIEDTTNSNADRLTIASDGTVGVAGDLTVDSGTIYVDSTNNRLGVNTTTPASTLDVRADSGSTIIARNTGTPASIAMSVGSSTNQLVSRGANVSTARDLIFMVGNTTATRLDSNGHLRPETDSTFNLGANTVRWANVYADTYYGDGSNLTGVTSTTINNNADNRIITGSGTANTLEGESTLTFDGQNLVFGAGRSARFTSGGGWSGNSAMKIEGHNNFLYLCGGSNGIIFRDTGGTDQWGINSSGHFFPQSNNTYDIGTSSYRVRNIYTNDLHLSNQDMTGGNDVDGTWGDWTIQEGESDLFLKNNRSGKKYKFNLTEVS